MFVHVHLQPNEHVQATEQCSGLQLHSLVPHMHAKVPDRIGRIGIFFFQFETGDMNIFFSALCQVTNMVGIPGMPLPRCIMPPSCMRSMKGGNGG